MTPRRFVTLTSTAIPRLRRNEIDGGDYYIDVDLMLTAVADDGSGWWAWIADDENVESANWQPMPAVPAAPPMPIPARPPSQLTTLRGKL